MLGFLREQQPGWVNDIAKVIKPELLLRDDLEPVLIERQDTLYGVSLNLDPLPADLAANEQQICECLSAHQHQLREQALQEDQTDKQLEALKKTTNLLNKQRKEVEVNRSQIQKRISGIKDELASLKQQIERSKQQRKQQLTEQKQDIQQQLDQLQQQLQTHKRQLDNDIKQQTDQLNIAIQQFNRDAEQQIEQIQHNLSDLDQQKNQALQQLEQQRLISLKNNNIDIDTLIGLEASIADLSAQRKAADEATNG